jgi:hypothetical protein
MRSECVAFVLLAFAVGDASAQCPPPLPEARDPAVRFAVLEPKLIFRHDLDLVGLSNFSSTFESAPKGWVVLGLTRRNDPLDLHMSTLQMPSLDGRTCYWITALDARLGGPDMDVYVAGNYAPGSCEYNTVLDHESQHVAINQDVLRAYVPPLGRALRAAVHGQFPVVSRTPLAPAQISEMVMRSVKPVYDQMILELQQKNAALDTPENYRRTALLCKNWFPPGTRMPDGSLRGK